MRFLFLNKIILNLQPLLLLTLLFALAASQTDPPMAIPNCVQRCGDITIPFPFGTTPDCYYNSTFWVTCNSTFKSTPTLFWQNTTIEITSISPLGQMTIMNFISSNCDYGNGTTSNFNPLLQIPPPFTVNNTANKFTIVGCDSYGYAYGWKMYQKYYSTGCTATCTQKADLEEGSCLGIGCCQTSFPTNVWYVNREVHSYRNFSQVREISSCTYGFLVEASQFMFHSDNLTNLGDVEKLPVVLDWAFGPGNATCEEARKNSSENVCKSDNSVCYEPGNAFGYRCRCADGYHGNPYLRGGCQDVDECSPDQNNSCEYECKNTQGGFYCICPKGYHGDGIKGGGGCNRNASRTPTLVAGIAVGVIILLLVVGMAFFCHYRRQLKRGKQKWFLQNGGELLLEKLPRTGGARDMLKIFSSSEMRKATNDFHKDNIVGQGGFGTVYKGVLSDRRTVAIKKSKVVDPNQIEQFVSEVIVVSQINHRNTVKLLGCCLETEVPHLVYEFINNGTLYEHLHVPKTVHLLNWEKRLKIAADTATVLSYLHSEASIPIIHRDVKSDNILLDHTFTAKVSDFGASRLIPLDQTQVSTVVQGTTGYLDPEYLLTHQLTAKSDVYSFGVVLLELITGRTAVRFDGPEKERSLVHYSLHMMRQNSFSSLIDGRVACDGNLDQIMEVARIAEWCIKMNGEERPDMKVVAMELESLLFRRKQSWGQTEENIIEVQPLLAEGFDGIIGSGIDSRTSTSGFNSFVDQVARPLSGGR